MRFWAKVRKTSSADDKCWLWTAAKRGTGYGSLHIEKNVHDAHRVSWVMANGRCDEPLCVRPSHLFLGTKADNVHDMHAKQRRGPPTLFLPQGVLKALEDHHANGDSVRKTAKRLGLSLTTVRMKFRLLKSGRELTNKGIREMPNGRWRVRLTLTLGEFDTREEAEAARENAARRLMESASPCFANHPISAPSGRSLATT